MCFWVGFSIIAALSLCVQATVWTRSASESAAVEVMVHFHLRPNDTHLYLYLYVFSDGEDWFCECPPLYTGRLCQFNACERNPCGHGATCIPKSPLEAVCLCPYGRQGLLCDEREWSRRFSRRATRLICKQLMNGSPEQPVECEPVLK